MKKIVMALLAMCIVFTSMMIGCTPNEKIQEIGTQPTVIVSIVPEATFVKAVAGDLVNVVTMIPPGYSVESYQPKPKEMMAFSQGSIYFGIGVEAEEAFIMPKVKDLNPNVKVVALDNLVGEVYPHRYFSEEEAHHGEDEHGHDLGGKDPHIWLSPKRVKVMVQVIRDELIALDPDHREIFEKNSEAYLAQLDRVDAQIKNILQNVKQQAFIVYHPSFGYFAEDYGLEMLSVEQSGKQATAKSLQSTIDFAKKNNIKVIFYQREFGSNQAETLAQEIGGEAVEVEPLAQNYIGNMEKVAQTFKKALE